MFINIFSSILFFVFITLSLTGCGDEESDNTRPRTGDSSGITQGQSDGSANPTPTVTTPPSDTTTTPQNPYHVERYNKELKPDAPAPDSTKTTTCTKAGESDKVIVVNEYFISQPPPPVAGTALMCDWLENGTMRHFATVERSFCSKKAQEKIDELKKEGYSCIQI